MYNGPYVVVKQTGPVNYLIKKNDKSVPFIVHVDKLKLCHNSVSNVHVLINYNVKLLSEAMPPVKTVYSCTLCGRTVEGGKAFRQHSRRHRLKCTRESTNVPVVLAASSSTAAEEQFDVQVVGFGDDESDDGFIHYPPLDQRIAEMLGEDEERTGVLTTPVMNIQLSPPPPAYDESKQRLEGQSMIRRLADLVQGYPDSTLNELELLAQRHFPNVPHLHLMLYGIKLGFELGQEMGTKEITREIHHETMMLQPICILAEVGGRRPQSGPQSRNEESTNTTNQHRDQTEDGTPDVGFLLP